MLRLYTDLKRILVVTENLLFLAGKSLQRRALRNGMLISLGTGSSIIKTNIVSAQTLSAEQMTALVIGAFASYPAGALLVRLATFLTREHIEAAAGGYLHLTSHYKQSRMRMHLHYLWHEVFSNEPRSTQHEPDASAEYSADDRETGEPVAIDALPSSDADTAGELGLISENPHISSSDRMTHDRFLQDALTALRSPLPMGIQSARSGFHLGPIEDWYEKGFFAYEDFPAKAFARDPLIKRAHRLVETRTRLRIQRLLAAETAPSFWYAFTVRKFSTLLGKAITSLNGEAEKIGSPDYFDAQHFIWPSVELDREVTRRFESDVGLMHRKLFVARQLLFGEVFTSDVQIARRHVMRMFARDYAWIFRLRLRFDAPWAAGRLHTTPMQELRAIENTFSLPLLPAKRVEPAVEQATTNLALLDRVVGDAGIGASENYALIQVAAHIDYRGLRSRNLEGAESCSLDELLDSAEDVRRDVGLLRELLLRVRIYHVLLKIQIMEYWNIVEHIGRPKDDAHTGSTGAADDERPD